jgi:DNA primase
MSAIEEIKQRLDIVEVVSQYTNLQKSGRNFKALCPFHAEKHPSFFVFPERQSWHCFGSCGSGGDIFAFIMKKENLEFGQALRLLAERAGVSLEHKDEARDKERERLYQVNLAAARFYHDLLLQSPGAELARRYLEGRGISQQAIADFGLGFSPDSWEALRQYMLGQGYQEQELLALGLVVPREGGGSYDRFRKRLMFPVRDEQGRVIGFGARALDDSLPKYLNSPQTVLFDKGGCLYGLERAKLALKQHNLAVIVEGYIDVIMAHQHGFANVVASLGTAITEKQMGLFSRWASNLALALDADAAGDEATLRGIQMASLVLARRPVPLFSGELRGGRAVLKMKSSLAGQIKVIRLPQGQDPDEIIRQDSAAWQCLVDGALPVVDYAFDLITSRVDLDKASERSRALESLVPFVVEVSDPVEQAHYIDKLASLARVDQGLVKARVSDAMKGAPITSPSRRKAAVAYPLEERYLCLLLQCPEFREKAGGLSEEYFEHSPNREVFLAWRRTTTPAQLKEALDQSLHDYIDSLLTRTLPPASMEQRQVELEQCLLRLRERWLKGLAANDELLLAEARAAGDAGGLATQLERAEEAVALGAQLKQVFESSLRHLEPKE